jgi:hypothetical protein
MIRLAFDPAAAENERRNSTDKLIAALRSRGITADQFLNNGGSSTSAASNYVYENLYRKLQTEVSGLRTENQSLANDKKRLEQKISELSTRTSQPYTSPASGSSPRSSRMAQPMSSKVRFDTYQAGYWYATDNRQTQWSIGNMKGRICLHRKHQFENRFKAVGHYATIAEAVKEMESWIR